MENIVCHECGLLSSFSIESPSQLCEACGTDLSAVFGGQADAMKETAPVENETLVADLRDAFGLSAGELVNRGTSFGWLSSGKPKREPQPESGSSLDAESRIGDFQIISELGRGGMGIVYRARQLSLDREVALKVLPHSLRHGGRSAQRFLTEAKAAARLNHTNIVPVYARGEHDGQYYYAMKLVEGASLDAVIKSSPQLLSSSRASSSESVLVEREVAQKPSGDQLEPADASVEQADLSDSARVHRSRRDYMHIAALLAEVADGLAHAQPGRRVRGRGSASMRLQSPVRRLRKSERCQLGTQSRPETPRARTPSCGLSGRCCHKSRSSC